VGAVCPARAACGADSLPDCAVSGQRVVRLSCALDEKGRVGCRSSLQPAGGCYFVSTGSRNGPSGLALATRRPAPQMDSASPSGDVEPLQPAHLAGVVASLSRRSKSAAHVATLSAADRDRRMHYCRPDGTLGRIPEWREWLNVLGEPSGAGPRKVV